MSPSTRAAWRVALVCVAVAVCGPAAAPTAHASYITTHGQTFWRFTLLTEPAVWSKVWGTDVVNATWWGNPTEVTLRGAFAGSDCKQTELVYQGFKFKIHYAMQAWNSSLAFIGGIGEKVCGTTSPLPYGYAHTYTCTWGGVTPGTRNFTLLVTTPFD